MWDSQNFPFLSQSLFNATSTFTNYTIYDQSLILKSDFTIDESKLAAEGIPYLTGTYIAYLITSNAGLTATLVHMLLWNWNDLGCLELDSSQTLVQIASGKDIHVLARIGEPGRTPCTQIGRPGPRPSLQASPPKQVQGGATLVVGPHLGHQFRDWSRVFVLNQGTHLRKSVSGGFR